MSLLDYLNDYNKINERIMNNVASLKKIKLERDNITDGIQAQVLTDMPKCSNSKSSIQERTIIQKENIEDKIKQLEYAISIDEEKIIAVNSRIATLNYKQQYVIKKWFCDGIQVLRFVARNYEKDFGEYINANTVKRWKREALNYFK